MREVACCLPSLVLAGPRGGGGGGKRQGAMLLLFVSSFCVSIVRASLYKYGATASLLLSLLHSTHTQYKKLPLLPPDSPIRKLLQSIYSFLYTPSTSSSSSPLPPLHSLLLLFDSSSYYCSRLLPSSYPVPRAGGRRKRRQPPLLLLLPSPSPPRSRYPSRTIALGFPGRRARRRGPPPPPPSPFGPWVGRPVLCGWAGEWVRRHAHRWFGTNKREERWVGGWVGEWVGGWVYLGSERLLQLISNLQTLGERAAHLQDFHRALSFGIEEREDRRCVGAVACVGWVGG